MNDLFAVLFLVCLILIPIGLIKPQIFTKIFKKIVSRKRLFFTLLGLSAAFFILFGITSDTPKKENIVETTPQASNLPSNSPIVSPIVKSTSSPIPELIKVIRVVDGDTIQIEGGKVVRYIGMDTPEIVSPSKPIQCYAKEASDKNKELVLNKEVRLEKDVSEVDKYGRLLRYVWIGETMVNELLVREGYAQASSYPPDIKYQDRFTEAQRKAREENKGLWSSYCVNWGITPTPQPTTKTTSTAKTPTPTVYQPQSGSSGTFVCNCSKTCSNMSSCAEAQYQLNICGCSARDADKDGIACDVDCQ